MLYEQEQLSLTSTILEPSMNGVLQKTICSVAAAMLVITSIASSGCVVGDYASRLSTAKRSANPTPSQSATPLEEQELVSKRSLQISPSAETGVAFKTTSQTNDLLESQADSGPAKPSEPQSNENGLRNSDLYVAQASASQDLDNDPQELFKTTAEKAIAEESSEPAITFPDRTETAQKRDLGAESANRAANVVQVSNAPYRAGAEPWTVDDELPENFWELSLDDVIEMGLQNATVLRSLGGQVLQNPQGSTSIYEPSLRISDPVFGEEASLSAFDAQLQSNMTYQNNDNVFNSAVSNGGVANSGVFELQQDLYNWNVQLQKVAANGMQFSLNRTVTHDNNDAPQNAFSHAWNNALEATIRMPLLQGGGVEFNRIAGPNGQPGFRFNNGVVIAQIDGRLSVAEFEQAVQAYLSEVVTTYWQLYLAYRNYESAVRARETAYETWRVVEARFVADLEGGEADREAQAREQLLTFGQQVLVALSGDQRIGSPGVYQAEANLRRMIGIAARDDRFIKPNDIPTEARTVFDWQNLTTRASEMRPELRQQQLRVRQRELEMLASKNFLLPRLDLISTYRFTGFGDDLAGGGPGRFSDAFKDFYSGDHQESEFGLQLSMPIGFRREYAGFRNAELALQRERGILADQHEQVYHDLGNAVRQVALDYRGLQNAYNRLVAANQAVEARLHLLKRTRSRWTSCLRHRSVVLKLRTLTISRW